MNRFRLSVAFFLSAMGAVSVPVYAADLSDYVYANYLGSGLYSAAGRDVLVIGIPFTFPKPIHTTEKLNVVVKVPVTIGLYDFSSDAPLAAGQAERLATLTVVPSINFEYQVTPKWNLAPFIDLGFGQNFADGDIVGIYATGLHSDFYFGSGNRFRLGNRLLYAGHTASDTDLASFDTGIEFNQPLGGKLFGKDLDVSLYAVNYLFLQNLNLLRSQDPPVTVAMQYEIGFTFGLKNSINRPTLKIPRIGIGYRFGGNVEAVRILFGVPF